MGKIAYDIKFGNQTSYIYGVDAYDSTKLGLGTKIIQRSGDNVEDNYVAPPNIGFARPIETGAGIPAAIPQVINWSSTTNWVFFTDQAAAAATRRIQLYVHNIPTGEMTWKGFITNTFPTATTHTVVGFQPIYDKYVTGTASVSGSTVTGSGTAWQSSGICVGNRIGFGSSVPSEITTWYEISAVNSNTTLTLTTTASITDGPYVIEDLRMAQVTTNATATNGGLFLTKGLRFENFNGSGTVIAAASTVDNIRAVYWLADAATVTNTVGIGCDLIKTDWSTQHLYVLNTVANPILFKYNIRASLTSLAAGKSTAAFVLLAGAHGALTGAPVQTNNFCIAKTFHGNGAGKYCGYFTTATRFYRTQDVTTITSGQVGWGDGVCLEVPPGGTLTNAATASLKQPIYIPSIDRFVITTASRAYLTQFKDDSSQWDRIFLSGSTQTLQVNADNTNTYPFPSYTIGAPFYTGANTGANETETTGGTLFMASTGLTNILNYVYAVPIGADWESTDANGLWAGSKQCLITPKILTYNIDSFVRTYTNVVGVLGSASSAGKNLGQSTEPIKISYRTSGIDDDSGIWTYLSDDGDLSSLDPTSVIQFRVEWRVAGQTCIPGRLTSMGVIYNDLATDMHYQPSVGQSSISNKQFAWRFSTAFGTTVPRLKIRLYDAVEGTLLSTDDSVTQAGVWEKSTNNGVDYAAYDTTDKSNDDTYIRYTPVSLGDNLRVRALLTEY